jgi:hypothetical protein
MFKDPELLDQLDRRARISAPSQVWVELTEAESAYVKRYWERKRYADQKAQESSNRWEKRNGELKEYVRQANDSSLRYSGRLAYNDKSTRDKFENDWELTDAFSAWHFWQRESLRCQGVLEAELNARRLLGVLPL